MIEQLIKLVEKRNEVKEREEQKVLSKEIRKIEIELAKKLKKIVPRIDRVYTNSFLDTSTPFLLYGEEVGDFIGYYSIATLLILLNY